MKCPKCKIETGRLINGACSICGYKFLEEQEKLVPENAVQEEDEGIKKAKSVQLVAKIFLIIGIIASIIGAIVLFVLADKWDDESLILYGFATIAVGIVLSWIIYTLISGFAMLIKKTSLIEQHINNKK